MTFTVRPFDACLGAEVVGLDLSPPLADEQRAAIIGALDEHAVVVLRGQALSQDGQVALARAFGPLDLGLRKVSATRGPTRLKHEHLLDISNVAANDKIADRDSMRIVSNIANQLWHSDSSFQAPAARYSMLHAIVVAPTGGNTEFCDLRAAYDELPADLREAITGLEAEHYALHSRFMLGVDGYTARERDELAPVCWPIVRTHQGSGRRHLFIGAHARNVPGMTVPEGRMLLLDLLEHATQPRFVYTHSWQVGDLVIWDNRCTLHRGRRFDLSARREMRRTTTLDVDAA